jgi:hypothetical protein
MSDLKDDLTDIMGVGDATADSIIGVLDDHGGHSGRYLEKALDAAADGDDRTAAVYLRRHLDE